MPAGEEERRAGSRKCWKYTNTPQIRIRIHKIHTERQEIHKYKNTDTHKYKFHCWESKPDRKSRKMRFFWKILLTKTALTSVPEKFRKLPGCQNDRISQGKIPPSKVECVKNLFMGVKGVRSIKKLGEDRLFLILRALLWTHQKFKPNINAHFSIFWPPLFFIISQMKRLYLAEEKIRKCLVHFFRIHGVSVTSFWEEFLLEPLQTIELFFSVFSYMIVICILLPASTISWTGWWAIKKLKTSKTKVLNQWSVLAKFQKKDGRPVARRGERGGEKNKCR